MFDSERESWKAKLKKKKSVHHSNMREIEMKNEALLEKLKDVSKGKFIVDFMIL